jgi:hypothetical protein
MTAPLPIFTRGVSDPFCPDGHIITTTTDHRLLWHIRMALSGMGGDRARELQRDLSSYLNATCDHHWHGWAGDDCIAAHVQCLWCNDVVWAEGPGPDAIAAAASKLAGILVRVADPIRHSVFAGQTGRVVAPGPLDSACPPDLVDPVLIEWPATERSSSTRQWAASREVVPA